jgi:hypothetical protein
MSAILIGVTVIIYGLYLVPPQFKVDSESLSLRNLDSIVARVSSISTGPDYSSANSQQPTRSPADSEHNAAAATAAVVMQAGHYSHGSGTAKVSPLAAAVAGKATATVVAKKYEPHQRSLHYCHDDGDDEEEVLYRQVCAKHSCRAVVKNTPAYLFKRTPC